MKTNLKKIISIKIILLLIFVLNLFANQSNDFFYRLDSDFNKVTYLDSLTIIIVGTHGAIVVSNDGGINWRHDYSGTRANLNGVAKIDESRAIAVGDSGVILRTEDKGKTWSIIHSGITNKIRAVSFSDNNFGIAAGDNGAMLITTDGGINWYAQNQPSPNDNFFDVFVFNDKIFFIARNTSDIYITFDGGKKWFIAISGLDNNSVKNFAKSDNGNIYLLSQNTITVSKDTGKTWIKNPLNNQSQWLSNFQNDSAIILSQKLNYYLSETAVSVLDNNFNADSIHIDYDTLYPVRYTKFISAAFFNKQNGFAVGTNNSIYKTIDGGKTWQILSYYEVSFSQTSVEIPLGAMFFLNQNHGSVGSYYEKIFRTSNGGATWLPQKLDTIINFVGDIAGLYFKDEYYGIGISNGGASLLKTTDGGITYFQSWISTPPEGLRVKFLTDSIFILSGTIQYPHGSYSILVGACGITKDMGLNQKIYRVDTAVFNDCAVIDSNNFIVVGNGINLAKSDFDKPFISKTTDKGLTWSMKIIDSMHTTGRVEIVDSKNWYLSGYDTYDTNKYKYILKVLKSTDYGDTWHVFMVDSSYTKWGLMTHDKSDTIYVIGLHQILISFDKGNKWTEVVHADEGIYPPFRGVFKINNTIYVQGDSNLLLKNIDYSTTGVIEKAEIIKTEVSPKTIYLYIPYPNPANSLINFKFAWDPTILNPKITIKIYNIFGEEVDDISNFDKIFENHNIARIEYNSNKLPDGIYFTNFRLSGYSVGVPFVISK